MLKLRHTTLLIFSGAVWLVIGIFLMQLGFNLIVGSTLDSLLPGKSHPIMEFFESYSSRTQIALIMIALSLMVGYLKGKYVLGKSAQKGVKHILSLPNPSSLALVYSKKYYILLASMIALGALIKIFQVPSDIRGFVDVTIGSALINGSLFYFRAAYFKKVEA
jgi:hypothetical protein